MGWVFVDEDETHLSLTNNGHERTIQAAIIIGRSVTEESYPRFLEFLDGVLIDTLLDVTGWTRFAVKAAVIICSRRGLSVTFKTGNRITSPVSYPREGPLLEFLVDTIISEEQDHV